MNRGDNNRRRAWLAAGLVISGLAVAALAVGIQDVARDLIAVPLTYLAWLVDAVFKGIPQHLLLLALAAAGGILAARSVSGLNRRPTPPPASASAVRDEPRQRFWGRHLSQMETSRFSREKVALELRGLVLQALAGRHRLTLDEVEPGVANGAIEVPDEVRALIVDWTSWLPNARPGRWRWLKLRLAWLAGTAEPEVMVKTERIVRYIESQVEGAHDTYTRI